MSGGDGRRRRRTRHDPKAAPVEGRPNAFGRLTPAQVETLAQVYADTGNVTHAARSAGMTRETARRYLRLGRFAVGPTDAVEKLAPLPPAPTPKKRPDLGVATAYPGRVKLRLPGSFAAGHGPNALPVPAEPSSTAETFSVGAPDEPPGDTGRPVEAVPAEPPPRAVEEPRLGGGTNGGGGSAVPFGRPTPQALDPAYTLDATRADALRLLRSIRGGTFVLWLQRVNELLTPPRDPTTGKPIPNWKPSLAALRLVRMADLRDVIELEQLLLGQGTSQPDVDAVRRARENEELLVQALIAQRSAAAAAKARAAESRQNVLAEPDDEDDARPN